MADKAPERSNTLSEADRAELAQITETTTPEDHGFEMRLWTRDIVAALIEARFGITFTAEVSREAHAKVSFG